MLIIVIINDMHMIQNSSNSWFWNLRKTQQRVFCKDEEKSESLQQICIFNKNYFYDLNRNAYVFMK